MASNVAIGKITSCIKDHRGVRFSKNTKTPSGGVSGRGGSILVFMVLHNPRNILPVVKLIWGYSRMAIFPTRDRVVP